MNANALLRQRQRRSNARDTPSDHQDALFGFDRNIIKRPCMPYGIYRRTDDVGSPSSRVFRGHPCTLFPDVGNVQEIWVKPCLSDTFAESALMDVGRARRNYDSLEA